MYIEQTLTLSTKSEHYANAKKYYEESVTTVRPHRFWLNSGHSDYNEAIVQPFYQWLATQGGRVVWNRRDNTLYGLDSYNIAPGSDVLEFESGTDLMMFVLRWS